MDPAHSKTHVRRNQVRYRARIKLVEADVSRSFNLSCPLAKTLAINCPWAVTTADAEAGGWIRGFSCLAHLEVGGYSEADILSTIPFVPFHGLSPCIKSLRLDFAVLPSWRIFNLIISFPLLEDLSLTVYHAPTENDDGLPTVIQPSRVPSLLPLYGPRRGVVHHTLVVVPTGRHPLPGVHLHVVSR